MESALAYRLRLASAAEKPVIVHEALMQCGDSFEPEIAETILAAGCEAQGPGPTAAYISARTEGTPQSWERFFRMTQVRDPFDLLAYARVLPADQAVLQVRRALSGNVRYAFFPRAEKLISRLARQADSHLRECRIALLGSSTTSLLAPVLQAYCLRDRIKAEIYEGLYGSASQEILDPESGLAKFRPQIVFLLGRWQPTQTPRLELWERLATQFGCHVVQQADAVSAETPSYVSILDSADLERQVGREQWDDPAQWFSFQQYPATEALPALADAMLAHCRAVLGLTRKVLVTDLDNTLWKGVIGEDGLDGIQVGPGSPAGEAHRALQESLLKLKERGILLAVASKNNHEDACLPFEKHPHMLLRMEDFAAFEANWNDKASSLREIARKLSLGLDSFVFLDDNPIEREWVRSQLPEVAVPELGDSVFGYLRELERGRYFFTLSLSAEDRARAELYRSEAARQELQAKSQSLEEFLAELQLRPWFEPVNDKNLARVAQLTNKTNQFNLTTRRYTEPQVRQLAADPAGWSAAFHLSDRMGDYGLIGVLLCRPIDQDRWEIDTWLMSCRVLGRRMERFMLDKLVEAARERGVREVIGIYRPTAKSGLVKDHYENLGFVRTAEHRYALSLEADDGSQALREEALSS